MKNSYQRTFASNISGVPTPGKPSKGTTYTGAAQFRSVMAVNTPAEPRELGISGASNFGYIMMDLSPKRNEGPKGFGVTSSPSNRRDRVMTGKTILKRGTASVMPNVMRKNQVRSSMLMK